MFRAESSRFLPFVAVFSRPVRESNGLAHLSGAFLMNPPESTTRTSHNFSSPGMVREKLKMAQSNLALLRA